jgi:hypothetical protein
VKEKDKFKQEHMMDLKGKNYLPVAARIVLFRSENPDWSISTQMMQRGEDGPWYVRAEVHRPVNHPSGAIQMLLVSSAHKEIGKAKGQAGYWPGETAETGAIGRALGLAGWGTMDGDFDEGDELADAPVESNVIPIRPDAQPMTIEPGDPPEVNLGSEPNPTNGDAELPTEPKKLIRKINYCRDLKKLKSWYDHVLGVITSLDDGSEERTSLINAWKAKEESLEQKGN